MAVVRLLADRLEVVLYGTDGVASDGASPEFAAVGLREEAPGRWVGPVEEVEPVYSLLDRLGYTWGGYSSNAPRTFAERIFAECPDRLAPSIYASLRAVFDDAGAEFELAVLEHAWTAFDRARSAEDRA
jgi:hypothetical protein